MGRHGAGVEAPRVLVVDDDQVNQMVIQRMLQILDLDADVVGDGTSALQILAQRSYDLVLMDLTMPGLDGLETTRSLRRHEQDAGSSRTRVVALTGAVTAETRRACVDAGMDDFLAKPVDLAGLGDMIERGVTASVGHRRRAGGAAAGPDPVSTSPMGALEAARALDPLRLDALAEELGDLEIVRDLVAAFLSELPARQQEIEAADLQGDPNALAVVTHTLKSAAAYVGATRVVEICAELEVHGWAGDIDDARRLLPDLHRATQAARQALSARLAVPVG